MGPVPEQKTKRGSEGQDVVEIRRVSLCGDILTAKHGNEEDGGKRR